MAEKNETAPPAVVSEGSRRREDRRTKGALIFDVMTRKNMIPLFLFVLPAIWAVFVGVGWTQDDKIEKQVYNIWTRQRSGFAADKEYADEIGKGDGSASTFAALASARDGGNLFTPSRLEEIVARMQETEGTTVSFCLTARRPAENAFLHH